MYQTDEDIRNLRDLVEKKAAKNRGKVAIVSGGRQATYDELNSNSDRIAGALKGLGVGAGDKVALMMSNSFEFLYCWFAAMKLGGVLVPLNISLKGDLLRYQVDDSDAKIVVVEKAFLEPYLAIKSSLAAVTHHIYFDREAPNDAPNGFLPYARLASGEEMKDREELKWSSPATIIYTSGTTGPPKGVVLPHFSYINTALQNAETAEVREGDVFFSTVPFFHTSGQLQVILPALIHDLEAAFEPWFHASQWWTKAREYRATVVFLISSMVNILLKQPQSNVERDHKVRVAMTGGARKLEWEEFESRFNVMVLEGFGMSETGAITLFNRRNDYRIGSVGKPLPHFEARIVDDYDNELPAVVKGELVIRPRTPYTMMLEYYKKPRETVEAWRNLWFHTGDILYKDEDGYYFFVERKKDVIRRRGENIAPYDIERIVNGHPEVLEAVAVGVPSELADEEVKICVQVKPGRSLEPMELLRWCDERLPYHMVPRYIEFVDEVPKTSTQKVQRNLLRKRGVEAAFDAMKAGFRPRKPV